MGFLDRQSLPTWGHISYRFVQMIMGIVVIGLYAQDLNRAAKEHKYSDSKWVYATVVGSLSAITALVYMGLLFLSSSRLFLPTLFVWDWVIFILWAAVFGIFGKLYIGTKVEMEPGIQRMKNAVWIDLVNMLLWFVSGIGRLVMFFVGGRGGGGRLRAGRAKAGQI